MTDAEIIAQNSAWLGYIRGRLWKIAWDFRATSQTPGMRFRFKWGTSETDGLNLPVQPSSSVVTWWSEITAYHKSLFPTHRLCLNGATIYLPEDGKTVFIPPAGMAYAAPLPSPYDLPKPDDLPIQCIPCIIPPQTARQLTII